MKMLWNKRKKEKEYNKELQANIIVVEKDIERLTKELDKVEKWK